jgi:branched-chain amino acid aminotransferase
MDRRQQQLSIAGAALGSLAALTVLQWLRRKRRPQQGPKAWMQGRVIPLSEATLPVNDWGVVHSDITYDVAPVVSGAFFRIDDYIGRFLSSAAALHMDVGLSAMEIKAALCRMVGESGLRDAYVAMVVSRGVPLVAGSRDPRDCGNHFYAWCVPYVHIMHPDKSVGGGASAWVAKTVRRTPKSCFDPRIKNYQWGDMTAGLLEAKERGFDTTILLDHDGCVTEGPGFNVFSVQAGGRLVTAESGMLEGISRRTVLEICRAEGYTVEERPLPLDELMRSEEVFITSTAGGVMPLTRVDDLVFGGGDPGAVARRLRESYWEMVRKPELRTEIEFAA